MIFQKYKVILSNKAELPIDEDEVDLVVGGISSGQIVKVRQGIFNPSYFVALVIDQDRKERYLSDNQYRKDNPDTTELKQLPNIFEGLKLGLTEKLRLK